MAARYNGRRVGRQSSGIERGVTERDSKRIIRQWNREIEDEIRRQNRVRDNGPWKAVVWAALWLMWLAALVALVGHIKTLR